MPKSKHRKKRSKPTRPKSRGYEVIKLNDEMKAALEAQMEAFRKKFGREPGPKDPIFFDPDSDIPVQMKDPEAEILQAMQAADLPPEFAYAFKKTGLLGFGKDKSQWPADRVAEWNAAIEEYHAIQSAAADKPPPDQWSSSIPEMLASSFNREDLAKVKAIVHAMVPFESTELTLMARIELAAAVLATTLEHSYKAGEATMGQGEGPTMFEVAQDLVVRRAREIFAQGRA